MSLTGVDEPPGLRSFIAVTAVGPTSLRKMRGTAGRRPELRAYFEAFDLSRVGGEDFYESLDRWTSEIEQLFTAPNWGAARKSINLFLRDCSANFWLRERFSLSTAEPFFELPLDSRTMTEIAKRTASHSTQPPAVSNLTRQQSDEFQKSAAYLAGQLGVLRVHLDYIFWTNAGPSAA